MTQERSKQTDPEDPVELLRALLRYDTTNPPGNEGPCIGFLAQRFERAGLKTTVRAKDRNRPNLIARLPGRGEAPPLLLYGHVDVVPAKGQRWRHPPFEAVESDGYLWGRGALDMKSGVAMMASAVLRAAGRGVVPAGDVLFAALSDEEAGGYFGARYLVEEHPEDFAGVRYAIGEFGGFPLWIGGQRFYLVQVSEKQPCWIEGRLTGPAGHGALPMRGGAMANLGRVLTRLDRRRLPVHITPTTRRMVKALAEGLSPGKRIALRRLLSPHWTDTVLKALGQTGRAFEPLFRNTVNATIVRAGDKPNVIPSEILLGLDVRLLPGFAPDDLYAELRTILGGINLCYEVKLYDQAVEVGDLGLFDLLGDALREQDPGAIPIPYMLPGSTDARFFSALGIQSYGFTPMRLPAGFSFFDTIHAADERIPMDAVRFGADTIYRLIERYPG